MCKITSLSFYGQSISSGNRSRNEQNQQAHQNLYLSPIFEDDSCVDDIPPRKPRRTEDSELAAISKKTPTTFTWRALQIVFLFLAAWIWSQLSHRVQTVSFLRGIADSLGQGSTNAGFVACLTDKASFAHAFTLADSIQQNPVSLELYHYGSLSHDEVQQLKSFEFVTVVDLSSSWFSLEQKDEGYPEEMCLEQALEKTYLNNVLAIPPSLMFFINPQIVLDVVRNDQKQEQICCECAQRTCVTLIDSDYGHLNETINREGFCTMPSYLGHVDTMSHAILHDTQTQEIIGWFRGS